MWTALPAGADDPGKIDGYVTPYYNSSGPVVHAGKYSAGLASTNQSQLVATIRQMKKSWNQLNFVELYVGAIRLYDMGYRTESTYWFYTAQYRGRLFAVLVDQKKMGSIGSPVSSLPCPRCLLQLVGPKLTDCLRKYRLLLKLSARFKRDRTVPNMAAIYPAVSFSTSRSGTPRTKKLTPG